MAEASTVARWELALRIKARRKELGITADEVVKHLGFSRNFFSAVENERAMLAEDKLEILMELLRFDNVERSEFRELNRVGRDKGWWEERELEEVFGEHGVRFFGLEQGAGAIRLFDSSTVPGLLQTPDYYRALLKNDPLISRAMTASLIEIRERRQQEILGNNDVKLQAIIGEAALRQVWKDIDLRNLQLHHLASVSEANVNVDLRVLPLDSPPGSVITAGTMELMEFPSPSLPAVVYQEALRSFPILTEEDPQFQRLKFAWEDSFDLALSQEASIRKIIGLTRDD